jgi:site-specific recombinase XerD
MQNGEPWLKMKTKKTGTEIQIPLFLIFGGKALKILNQYASIENFAKVGKNSYVNQRLSELQQMLHINTRITFHTARHTCATLLCHQGIPITTVQKILGHSNITTTQVYSEVMAETIVRDLSKGFGKTNSREHH